MTPAGGRPEVQRSADVPRAERGAVGEIGHPLPCLDPPAKLARVLAGRGQIGNRRARDVHGTHAGVVRAG